MEDVHRESDLAESSFNLANLKPRKRFEALVEICKKIHIDYGLPVKKYFQICSAILLKAERSSKKNRSESALMNYLKYQFLIKKLKKHPKFTNLPIGDRSSLDYKMKEVTKHVKELSEKVLGEYKRFYEISKFTPNEQDLEGCYEQRPTFSTVRTFVSNQEKSNNKNTHLPTTVQQSQANRPRDLTWKNAQSDDQVLSTSSLKLIALHPSASLSNTSLNDQFYGIRRSIFTPKQVREFDQIYSQRRIVRDHKTMIVPSRVTTEFSHLSLANTKKNIETVAYLAGKLNGDNDLVVTHMILPEQLGFSDYFKVRDSNHLIRYLEKNDLMTLGWIHSHPIEAPYLTSSDMHYHSVFQSVIQEAIAMVYSPVHMKSVIFNLTPNYGLQLILDCHKKGFHTHPTVQPLTMVSQHSIIDLCGGLVVEDLRNLNPNNFEVSRPTHSDDMFGRMFKTSKSWFRIRKSEVNFVHI